MWEDNRRAREREQPEVAYCRSCNAQILWMPTRNGKRMPLDVKPVATGNIWINDGHAEVIPAGVFLPADRPRYRSHFATCPHAEQWRQR